MKTCHQCGEEIKKEHLSVKRGLFGMLVFHLTCASLWDFNKTIKGVTGKKINLNKKGV